MKKLLWLLLAALTFSSCSIMKPKGMAVKATKKEPPYVKLKDGREIDADKVHQRMGFMHEGAIKADDAVYKAKDVAFYSDGKGVYANTKQNGASFAKKITEGNINVYRNVKTTYSNDPGGMSGMGGRGMGGNMGMGSGMGMGGGMGNMAGGGMSGMGGTGSSHMSKRIVDYIQLGDTGTVKLLCYKNLRPMIHQRGGTADDILNRYAKVRKTGRIIGWVGAGMIVGGLGLVAASHGSTTLGGIGLGAAVLGFPTAMVGIVKVALITTDCTRP